MIIKRKILIFGVFLLFFILAYFLKPLYYSSLKIPLSLVNKGCNLIRKINPFYKMQEKIKIQQELIDKLQSKIYSYQEMEQEFKRLRKLLGFKGKINYSTIVAKVIARIKNGTAQIIVLNKGKKSGIKRNQAVIYYSGLVGRIIESYRRISRAILITDLSSSVTAKILRTGDSGLLKGNGRSNSCDLLYLDPNSDVKVGDKVITSGMGQVFPANIPIGEVISVGWDSSQLYKKAEVKLFTNLNKLEEVLVILK